MAATLSVLADQLGLYCKANKLFLVTAESCTGGGLGYWVTSIPGSSDWYDRGFVTYSNTAKMEMLGVKEVTLKQFGAVSAETAIEMAEGALKNSHANISIAITGIAGPDGGTAEKPVGTVWIAVAGKSFVTHAELKLHPGDRKAIRDAAIEHAMQLLLQIK